MYFDLKELYAAAEDGFTVFSYYFNDPKLKDPRHKFKIRDEKSASAQLSYYHNLWRITDFGNQSEINGMSPIDYVMYREGLPFADAVKFINEVILRRVTVAGNFKPAQHKPLYASRDFNPETDKLQEYRFSFRKEPLPEELKSIGRYVTKEILAKFNCRAVEQYEYAAYSDKLRKNIVHIYTATVEYPIFVFDYGEFKKLYRPLEPEKKYRFIYIGAKPKNYIFGLKQLLNEQSEFNDDDDDDSAEEPEETSADDPELEIDVPKAKRIVKEIYRCSGESDALNLASLGFHVYWLNSESAELDARQFREIDQYAEKHYQIMDLDATGQAEAAKNALKHIELFTVVLPEWIKYRRDWRGNPCKDLKDFINLSGDSRHETEMDFRVLKSNARRAMFWQKSKKKDKDGKKGISFSMEYFYFFLKLNGFYRIDKSYVRKHDYMYVKIDNNKTFRLISPDKITSEVKTFTKQWIENRKMMAILPLLDKINTSIQITDANLKGLPLIELNFRNFGPATEYLHFANGSSIRITPNEIRSVRQNDVPNYIFGDLIVNNKHISHIINFSNIRILDKPPVEVNATPAYQALLDELDAAKTVEQTTEIYTRIDNLPDIDKYSVTVNDSDFFFVQFLQDLAHLHWRKEIELRETLTPDEIKEQNLCLANLLFTYGYLAAEYKDSAKSWIVVTMDNKISEVGEASGRSGKSLKTLGLRYVRPVFYKGGRDLDDKDNFKFLYDGLTEFHPILEIDDFAEFGLFDRFYTEITGGRVVNPKNYSGFTLDYKESGKMVISTNYELHNISPSTHARLLYETISDYYHEKTSDNDYRETRKPDRKFGRRLYDDFSADEWNKFYNLIAYCIQMTMRFYKINPPTANIRKRELRREMQRSIGKTDDFFKWANTYFRSKPDDFNEPFAPAAEGYFNTYIVKKNAYENFVALLSAKQKSDYRITKFKDHVAAWCRYYGYKLNPAHLVNDEHRIIKKYDGASVECLFIAADSAQNPVAVEPEHDPDPNFDRKNYEMPF